jgi:hypothetical protein
MAISADLSQFLDGEWEDKVVDGDLEGAGQCAAGCE